MKNVIRLLTGKFFMIAVFCLGIVNSSEAQYKVGSCGTCTHSTLTAAYNDARILPYYSDFTIEVMPGTYANEVLEFLPHSLRSNKYIRIIGLGGPGAAEFRISSAASANFAAHLNGVDHLYIENLKFSISSSSPPSNWRVMKASSGAALCSFQDVIISAPNGSSTFGSDRNFTLCYLEEIADNFTFLNCTFSGGSTGMYWEDITTGTHPIVRVVGSDFDNQTRKFAYLDYGIYDAEFHLLDCDLSSTVQNDFIGVKNDSYDARILLRNNDFYFYARADFMGTELRGENIEVDNNSIIGVDCFEMTGVKVHDHADKIIITDNQIEQFLPTVYTNSPFIGVYYVPANQTAGIFSNKINLSNNYIWSQHQKEAFGIKVKLGGVPIMQEFLINDNEIYYPKIGTMDRAEYRGIFVDGGGAEVAETEVNRNFIQMPEDFITLDEVLVGGSGILLESLVHVDAFSVFNNKIEIEYESQDEESGISLTAIQKKAGAGSPPLWVGNNMISINSLQANSHGILIDDVDSSKVIHNSLHIYDTDSATQPWSWRASGITIRSTTPDTILELEIENNIVLMDAYGVFIDWDCNCPASLNYNLYFKAPHRINYRWRKIGTYYSSLISWVSATGQETYSKTGDPRFDQSGGDYYNNLHIQTGSAAFNAASILTFPPEALLLQDDRDGDARVGTIGGPDIGADEIVFSPKTGSSFQPESTWEMYPNPAVRSVTFAGLSSGRIRILDVNGREMEVFEVNESQVSHSLQDLSTGVYFVEFTAEGQKPQVRKLIRQ